MIAAIEALLAICCLRLNRLVRSIDKRCAHEALEAHCLRLKRFKRWYIRLKRKFLCMAKRFFSLCNRFKRISHTNTEIGNKSNLHRARHASVYVRYCSPSKTHCRDSGHYHAGAKF